MKSFIKSTMNLLAPSLFRKFLLKRYMKRELPDEFITHMNNLNKGDTVIDLGANVGLVSEILARKGLYVIAFEPNKTAFEELKKVAKQYPNIEIHNVAAGTENKHVKLFHHKDSEISDIDLTQSSSLLSEKPNVSIDLYDEVEEIDFAEFLNKRNLPIEILKIDIEGFEIDLINHLLDHNAVKDINKIYMETHERKFPALEKSTEDLKLRIDSENYKDKFFYEWH